MSQLNTSSKHLVSVFFDLGDVQRSTHSLIISDTPEAICVLAFNNFDLYLVLFTKTPPGHFQNTKGYLAEAW